MHDVFQPGYRGFVVRDVVAKALAAGRAKYVNCIGHDAAQRALFEQDETNGPLRPFEDHSINTSSDGKQLDFFHFVVPKEPESFSEE